MLTDSILVGKGYPKSENSWVAEQDIGGGAVKECDARISRAKDTKLKMRSAARKRHMAQKQGNAAHARISAEPKKEKPRMSETGCHELIGQTIEIYSRTDTQWCEAQVLNYDRSRRQHWVQCCDENVERAIVLDDEQYRK